MSIQYPQEILDQQDIVRKELEKLAKMRTDYLKSTGQMPPSAAKRNAAPTGAKHVAASTSSGNPEIVAS